MFKPHYGTCTQCGNDDQLIVVKIGHCQKCNYNNKQAKKKASGKKASRYKYTHQATGEGEMFREIALNNIGDEPTRCKVCKIPIPALTYSNMAHVLSKKQFPLFRLYPKNIEILCHKIIADENGRNGCHHTWDFRPRSEIQDDPMWQEMIALEQELKEEYKLILKS